VERVAIQRRWVAGDSRAGESPGPRVRTRGTRILWVARVLRRRITCIAAKTAGSTMAVSLERAAREKRVAMVKRVRRVGREADSSATLRNDKGKGAVAGR